MLEVDPRFSFRASDGVRIAYEIDDFTPAWKDVDTVVLLHAAMGTSRRFFRWVPPLCGRFRVARWDMRGHGASDRPPPGGLSIERLSTDLVEFLDHLGLDRAHVVGSSAGGVVAMHAALDHSQRFASLSGFVAIPGLRSSVGHNDYEAWKAGLVKEGVEAFLKRTAAQRFRLEEVDAGFVDWFAREAARNDPAFLADFVAMMTAVDFRERLGEIACPSLFVVASGDPVHSMENYELLKAVPDHRFVVYENMPHNITDAVPDRCVADLLAFLGEIGARSA